VAIYKALSPEFQDLLCNVVFPYGEGNAPQRIKEQLKTFKLDGINIKEFYDLAGI